MSADRDTHITSAQRSLTTVVDPIRIRRAELKGREDRLKELREGLEVLKKANDQSELFIRCFVACSWASAARRSAEFC